MIASLNNRLAMSYPLFAKWMKQEKKTTTLNKLLSV